MPRCCIRHATGAMPALVLPFTYTSVSVLTMGDYTFRPGVLDPMSRFNVLLAPLLHDR